MKIIRFIFYCNIITNLCFAGSQISKLPTQSTKNSQSSNQKVTVADFKDRTTGIKDKQSFTMPKTESVDWQKKIINPIEIKETYIKQPQAQEIKADTQNLNPKSIQENNTYIPAYFEFAQGKTMDKFTDNINAAVVRFIKKTTFGKLSIKMRLACQTSLADIFIQSLKHLIFKLSGITENLTQLPKNSINNLKKQIQYIALTIENYNQTTIYKNPEIMLEFMQYTVQFIKENIEISRQAHVFMTLDQAMNIAKTTCNIFQNQNIIFASSNVPAEIVSYFQESIDATQDLTNNAQNQDTITAICSNQGSMGYIIQAWNSFKQTDLYKIPACRQYAAFLTFLLIFENIMFITAILINQTVDLYQVTNPITVDMNIDIKKLPQASSSLDFAQNSFTLPESDRTKDNHETKAVYFDNYLNLN